MYLHSACEVFDGANNLVNTMKTGKPRLTNIRKTVITVSSDILIELKLQWIE